MSASLTWGSVESDDRMPCIGGGTAVPEPLGARCPGGMCWYVPPEGEGLRRGREAMMGARPPGVEEVLPPRRFWKLDARADVGLELRSNTPVTLRIVGSLPVLNPIQGPAWMGLLLALPHTFKQGLIPHPKPTF